MIKNIDIGDPLRLRKDEQNAALVKQLGGLRPCVRMGRESSDVYDASEGLIQVNTAKAKEVRMILLLRLTMKSQSNMAKNWYVQKSLGKSWVS